MERFKYQYDDDDDDDDDESSLSEYETDDDFPNDHSTLDEHFTLPGYNLRSRSPLIRARISALPKQYQKESEQDFINLFTD